MKTFLFSVPVFIAFACGSSGGGDNGDDSQAGSSNHGAGAGSGARSGAGDGGEPSAGTDSGEGGAAGSDSPAGSAGEAGDAVGGASGGGGAGAGGGSAGAPPVPPSVTFNISVGVARHAISPLIYGMNPQGAACDDKARFGLCRLGGHAWTAYNWETNASNAGVDNCFENDAALSASETPGAAVTGPMAAAQSVGAATLVQIPTLDYVAADKLGGSASPACSGDVRKSGQDYLSTRFKTNQPKKVGALSASPDATDASVAQDEFVSFLATKAQAIGAKVLFSLDNQPDTWVGDHPEIHPDRAGYAEVVKRNVDYATMIRGQWPAAEITGYVGYGYYGFQTLQDAPDKGTNGVFVDYYLRQMKAASATAGVRLIDYLDLHWYTEAIGAGARVIGDDVKPGSIAARVQAPRSFWDDSFVETSFITGTTAAAGGTDGGPISLIPRFLKKIADNYAGTKLAISEWNFGGGKDISGAVAAADSLGIFGREGVSLAAYVSTSTTAPAFSDPFVYGAFSAFRNYDGAGAAFGDTSVSAETSSVRYAPVYASVDSSDGDRLVMVAINRSTVPLPARFQIDHTASYKSADVYRLTANSPTMATAGSVPASSANTFDVQLPAYSIAVVVARK